MYDMIVWSTVEEGGSAGLAMVTHQQGRITFFHLFSFAIIAIVIFNGIKFFKPLRDYYQIKEAMQATINQARNLEDREIVDIIVKRAKQIGLKLRPQDIEITRASGGRARMRTEYDVTVTFPLGLYRDLTFRPEVLSTR